MVTRHEALCSVRKAVGSFEKYLFWKGFLFGIEIGDMIVVAQGRLLLGELSILHSWDDIVLTNAIEDYAKVNEILSVEAWQICEREQLYCSQELFPFLCQVGHHSL